MDRSPRSPLAVLLLLLACGDSSAGTSGASATVTTSATVATSTTATTSADTGTSASTADDPPAGSGSAASSGAVDPSTTGAPDPTTSTTGDLTSATTTLDATTAISGTDATSTSTSGALDPPPPPSMPAGCQACECCDPWPISWSAVPGATHYVVRWKCSINPEQVHDVGDKTVIADVCNDIEMCNGMCVFTVGYIKVEACNDDGCSASIAIPAAQAPITCGGGCCC